MSGVLLVDRLGNNNRIYNSLLDTFSQISDGYQTFEHFLCSLGMIRKDEIFNDNNSFIAHFNDEAEKIEFLMKIS